jgi:hypothetical protein
MIVNRVPVNYSYQFEMTGEERLAFLSVLREGFRVVLDKTDGSGAAYAGSTSHSATLLQRMRNIILNGMEVQP